MLTGDDDEKKESTIRTGTPLREKSSSQKRADEDEGERQRTKGSKGSRAGHVAAGIGAGVVGTLAVQHGKKKGWFGNKDGGKKGGGDGDAGAVEQDNSSANPAYWLKNATLFKEKAAYSILQKKKLVGEDAQLGAMLGAVGLGVAGYFGGKAWAPHEAAAFFKSQSGKIDEFNKASGGLIPNHFAQTYRPGTIMKDSQGIDRDVREKAPRCLNISHDTVAASF
jgi:hypothetical protein